MAIAIHSPGTLHQRGVPHAPGRHVVHRPPWVRRRQNDDGARLGLFIVALLAVAFSALILSGQWLDVSIPRSLMPPSGSAVTSRPTDGATPTAKLQAASTDMQPVPADASQPAADVAPAEAAPAKPALAAGARARVANTDGMGVVFYSAPRTNARMPAGLLEGTSVSVLDVADGGWARVQSDTNKSGWVHGEYLVPAE
jgi:Bacterial SH3 domain